MSNGLVGLWEAAQNKMRMSDRTYTDGPLKGYAITHRMLRSDATGGYHLACDPSRWISESLLLSNETKPVDCLLCLAVREGGPWFAPTGRRP